MTDRQKEFYRRVNDVPVKVTIEMPFYAVDGIAEAKFYAIIELTCQHSINILTYGTQEEKAAYWQRLNDNKNTNNEILTRIQAKLKRKKN